MEYRYMIWNDFKKEYQFPRICETTVKGANTCLFKAIGNDARKDRFKIVKIEDVLENIKRDNYEVYMVEVNPESVGQYTGLKDKNEKEIYEGDIVAIQFQRACKREKAVIKYLDKYAGFVLTETQEEKENMNLGDYQMENVEVIGNIYDNPELLGGKYERNKS